MLFSFPEVIDAGSVGNCRGLERVRFLHDGDMIELDVDGIGTLRNRIAMPQGSAV
ncbi:MAG TPA: hypothetical protein VNT30_06315 [Stellaceae bacterium]|nr:hypothetical protein [Stellaceae bacterium]